MATMICTYVSEISEVGQLKSKIVQTVCHKQTKKWVLGCCFMTEMEKNQEG